MSAGICVTDNERVCHVAGVDLCGRGDAFMFASCTRGSSLFWFVEAVKFGGAGEEEMRSKSGWSKIRSRSR